MKRDLHTASQDGGGGAIQQKTEISEETTGESIALGSSQSPTATEPATVTTKSETKCGTPQFLSEERSNIEPDSTPGEETSHVTQTASLSARRPLPQSQIRQFSLQTARRFSRHCLSNANYHPSRSPPREKLTESATSGSSAKPPQPIHLPAIARSVRAGIGLYRSSMFAHKLDRQYRSHGAGGMRGFGMWLAYDSCLEMKLDSE